MLPPKLARYQDSLLVPPPERVHQPDEKREGRQMAIVIAILWLVVCAVAAWVR